MPTDASTPAVAIVRLMSAAPAIAAIATAILRITFIERFYGLEELSRRRHAARRIQGCLFRLRRGIAQKTKRALRMNRARKVLIASP
jgi:hypothetical protein